MNDPISNTGNNISKRTFSVLPDIMSSAYSCTVKRESIPSCSIIHVGGKSIGVCNGRLGNDLPSEKAVVDFYKSLGIDRMRIYDPNQATLQALQGSNIDLIIGIPNQDIAGMASSQSAAIIWVQTNIVPFSPAVNFRYIAVGNEIKNGDPASQFLLPAIRNIYNAISLSGLSSNIRVSTSIEPLLLGASYPPSSGTFSDSASPYIIPIVKFLSGIGSPLLANVYTYFSYIANTNDININYALINAAETVVQDGELLYRNLFVATLDALYSALEKIGEPRLEIVVSETGWPSGGGAAATVENAGTYYKNVIAHVGNGTPKRPGRSIETYLFAMFDENQKIGAETEKHFGLFRPTKQAKYPLQF